MAASQPGFLEAARDGVLAARNASCVDGAGNSSHTAVISWTRFTVLGLGISSRRPLDPIASSLYQKLCEVDVVEAWAWWLVQHVGVNIETAWQYVGVANSHHERSFGVPFAGGMSLDRVRGMLDGWQRLRRTPVVRRMRFGVRPRLLRDAIATSLSPRTSALDANVATCLEAALVALARMGELVSGRGPFDRARLPSRADVRFGFRDGVLVSCAIWFVNSKARGAERFRKLRVVLPISGSLLSPGLALWYLCRVVDPVPTAAEADTPLFRDPATGLVLTVAFIRQRLRAILSAAGRDGSLYGAHSLRIGGATAMSWLQASRENIMAAGRWRSDAYLRYVRECHAESLRLVHGIASAETDDRQPDFLDIDEHGFDDDDFE